MYIRFAENRTEEELYQRHLKIQSKLEQKRMEQAVKETQECVFHPRINAKSSAMVEQRSRKLAESSISEYHDDEKS